ncbi:MAG: hypothetical protein DBX63_10995 [Clostridia bacterium]|nr:MAG: hypothetical protein DBX63_10995 [Clostridia bacterium]
MIPLGMPTLIESPAPAECAASSLKRKHAPPCARLWHGWAFANVIKRPRANAGCHSSYVKSTQSML